MTMKHSHENHPRTSPYKQLMAMTLVHIVIMYVAMFAMINRGAYFYHNTNMLYMAVLMAAPVTLFMLAFMRHMYQRRRLNAIIGLAFTLLAVGSYGAIRTQAGVGDKQFLRAMIPHHSGAILMCRQAVLSDPALITLCEGIIESQQREIDQMETMLKR